MIAEHLFKSGEKRDIFNHLMFVLDWNLMKRSENCLNVKMIHIEFEDDYLKFIFEKEKVSNMVTCTVHGTALPTHQSLTSASC